MTEEPDKQDTDFEFFRLINKAVRPEEEIAMQVRAALENTFGDENFGGKSDG